MSLRSQNFRQFSQVRAQGPWTPLNQAAVANTTIQNPGSPERRWQIEVGLEGPPAVPCGTETPRSELGAPRGSLVRTPQQCWLGQEPLNRTPASWGPSAARGMQVSPRGYEGE